MCMCFQENYNSHCFTVLLISPDRQHRFIQRFIIYNFVKQPYPLDASQAGHLIRSSPNNHLYLPQSDDENYGNLYVNEALTSVDLSPRLDVQASSNKKSKTGLSMSHYSMIVNGRKLGKRVMTGDEKRGITLIMCIFM